MIGTWFLPLRRRRQRWTRVAGAMMCFAAASVLVAATAEPVSTSDVAAAFVALAAPAPLAAAIRPMPPVAVEVGGQLLKFEQKETGRLQNISGELVTEILYARELSYHALWYQVRFTNKGMRPVGNIKVKPFTLRLDVESARAIPRVRYLTGSQHYDATYPSRAFEIVDRALLTADHAKPVEIGGALSKEKAASAGGPTDTRSFGELSKEYVSMMQVALQRGSSMDGFWVAFEWSSAWSMKAGYTKISFDAAPKADFEVSGDLALGDFVVEPGKTVSVPKVHLVFFSGQDWTPLENNGRRYIRERIAYAVPPNAQANKVTYDHWFGIHGKFNHQDMLRQARRAAELGCEYFCLDAGWYGKGAFGASGKGVWDEPDPVKFPRGIVDVQELSKVCRDSGMGFGLWSYLIVKNKSGGKPFDLATPEGVEGALETLRRWIKTYDLSWFRYEMAGTGGLQYQLGWDEVMARITREFPQLQIECCLGGGTRFDLGNMRFCTSTWLSDHTADPDVCRVTQTGALRFWPSYMLNSAVRVHRASGDSEATAYNIISRMPGTLSFNGDIAQWSDDATRRARELVEKYKSIRHLQSQPVFFPLPQVRTLEDWDVVCFGDGSGEAQLMYVFRVAGPDQQAVRVPHARGSWRLVMSSSEAAAKSDASGDGLLISMPARSASVWIRN